MTHSDTENPENSTSPDQRSGMFGLFDAISIILGIVVGTAIFKSPTMVFQNVNSASEGLALWLTGGVLSLLGALCYAELATTYPKDGGDLVYLTNAFGGLVGFLFGWAQLTVVLTASIASMSYVLADYSAQLWTLDLTQQLCIAIAGIIILTALNVLGTRAGKRTQNVLTAAKVLGILGLAAAGLMAPGVSATAEPVAGQSNIGLAMVFVLYAFGGWNDAAFVAAEVRGQKRNIPLALIISIAVITAIYLLINIVYLSVLGFTGLRATGTPASDVLQVVAGDWGSRAISVLVMISALGAMNGTILTGSRVYAALGRQNRSLAWLGRWNERRSTPVTALVAQAAVAVGMVLIVGTAAGRGLVDQSLTSLGLKPVPWSQYFGGFETLVAASAPVFWSFFLLTGSSLFVLRMRFPNRQRPFSVPLFPLPVIGFCGMCGYMLYSSLQYAGILALFAFVPVILGTLAFACGMNRSRSAESSQNPNAL